MSPIGFAQPVKRRLLMLEYVSGSLTDPMLEELQRMAHLDRSFEIEQGNLENLNELLKGEDHWVFFALVDDVEKLKALVHVFKSGLRSPIRSGKLLAIAVNRLTHLDVPRILKKMGFTEVISSTTIKADGVKSRIEELFDRFILITNPYEPPKPEPRERGLVVRECRLELQNPLATDSDMWLLRRPQDIRIVNDQWIIDLVGPGPSAGHWVCTEPVQSRSKDGHSTWKWEPSPRAPGLVKQNGLWIFEGRRPHFNEFHWTFTSRSPKLTYLENSRPLCDFFSVGPNQTLRIAANSPVAEQKWPTIHATILNEYRYSVPAPRIDTPNWKIGLTQDRLIPWRQLMGLDALEKPVQESRHELMRKIQASTGPQAHLFAEVADERTRLGLIREMSKRKCSALVWTTGQRIRFSARVHDSIEEKKLLIIEIPASLGPTELVDALSGDESQLFVNVALARGGVFFAADEVSIRDNFLEVVLPESLYQVQRRSHFRLEIAEEKGMFVRIGDQFHRVINLSGGGLAFVTGQANSAVFTQGTILPHLSFQVYDEKIHCKAEVRWSKPLPGAPEGSELTVGVQFHNLRDADEQKLNLYVLEEGFEYFRQHVLSL